MTQEKDQPVSYAETFSSRIFQASEYIAQNYPMFHHATGYGMARESIHPEEESAGPIGLLLRVDQPQMSWWKRLWKSRARMPFVGILNIEEKRNWLLEVYGRKHLELLRKMADDLASHFSIEIHVRLVAEGEKSQYYSSDSSGVEY
jgi:hypothetical protein